MTEREREFWRSVLRSGQPPGRKTCGELLAVLEDYWRREDGERGRSGKTAWESAERDLDSGDLARKVKAEIKRGRSRKQAIEAVARKAGLSGKKDGVPGLEKRLRDVKKRLKEIEQGKKEPPPVSLGRGGPRSGESVVKGVGAVTDTVEAGKRR